MSCKDFGATLAVRVFGLFGTGNDFLSGFGGEEIVTSLMLWGMSLATFSHDWLVRAMTVLRSKREERQSAG